jgi:hypothetical protein
MRFLIDECLHESLVGIAAICKAHPAIPALLKIVSVS